MTALALLELIIGSFWAFAAYLLFTTMAGMSEPVWGIEFVLFWGALSIGALLLAMGAIMILLGKARFVAAWLLVSGATLLTFWNVWDLRHLPADVSRGMSDGWVEGLTLGTVLLADISAVEIYRRVRRAR